MNDGEIQHRLKKYVEQEIDSWDFSGSIRIVKDNRFFGKPAGDMLVWSSA